MELTKNIQKNVDDWLRHLFVFKLVELWGVLHGPSTSIIIPEISSKILFYFTPLQKFPRTSSERQCERYYVIMCLRKIFSGKCEWAKRTSRPNVIIYFSSSKSYNSSLDLCATPPPQRARALGDLTRTVRVRWPNARALGHLTRTKLLRVRWPNAHIARWVT